MLQPIPSGKMRGIFSMKPPPVMCAMPFTFTFSNLKGEAGEKGPQGERGPAGPQGTEGATGPTGPAGPTGAQGPAGKDIVIGEVTATVDSESLEKPTVTVTKSNGDDTNIKNLQFEFKGLKGPQGEKGLQGNQGPAGPTGPQGL